MRRPHETSPSYGRLGIIVELGVRKACRGKLEKVHVSTRHGGDGQLWMFLSEGGDYLHIGIEAFTIDYFFKVRE